MLSRLRRNVRASLLLGILLLGALASATIDSGSTPDWRAGRTVTPLAAPRLEFELGRSRLFVTGTSASPAHERRMHGVAAQMSPDLRTELSFVPGVITPGYWADVSAGLFGLLPYAESAAVVLTPERLSFTGVSSAADSLWPKLRAVAGALPTGVTLDARITAVNAGTSVDAACRQMFAAVSSAPIAFGPASAELRRLSYGVLDRIAEFAWECPDLGISVIGHTDGVGDPAWNQRLSEVRATAVADYLVARGVAAERLEVQGKGAEQPLDDNSTAWGRALNRRIEFALRQSFAD